MPPSPVEVASVRPQIVRDQFRALGSIESKEIVQIVSELDGISTKIPFAEGQWIERGGLIAQQDDRESRATAKRAEAMREQAESNATRAEKLMQQQAISSQQLDDARTALKVAQAEEALAKARLAKTHITAPFSGLIGSRRVSPGAYLRSGDVITELARVDEMKVTFSAPERYLHDLKPGVPVQVTTPAFPERAFEGRLSVVDPMVDAQSRTVQLQARIPNPGRLLRPGMSANVSVTFSERTNALVVPDEAVFAEGSQSFVYVVKADSTVGRTVVTLGSRDSQRVEVLSGLHPGDTVVRTGHQKLFDGAHVMPIPDASEAGAAAAGAAPAASSPTPAPSAASASSTGAKGDKAAAPKPAKRGTR